MPEWAQLVGSIGAPLVLLGACVWWVILPMLAAGRERERLLVASLEASRAENARISERSVLAIEAMHGDCMKDKREMVTALAEATVAMRALKERQRRQGNG